MLSIRDTISRIARYARQIDTPPKKSVSDAINVAKTPRKVVPHHPKAKRSTQLDIYREFLQPLNIKNLKLMSSADEFDENSARIQWERAKHRGIPNSDTFLLQDRMFFHKMMDYLSTLVTEDLKSTDVIKSARYECPSISFDELPRVPYPLTPSLFREYIYILTHQKFLYRNSLSLKLGIVARILLYTHSLENDEFRSVRSVHTYNYLIKWFGYDKNQSSFARVLLLMMRKDGHLPNTDTINNLLKCTQIHSHIRSNTNTYQVVLEYLRLARKLNIAIDLSTFSRIYDCINNIFLRELFLARVQHMDLPMLEHLVYKILDDFAETTRDTNEVVSFIEQDLRCTDWRTRSKLSNKVAAHRMLHSAERVETLCDEHTIKVLMEVEMRRKGEVEGKDEESRKEEKNGEATRNKVEEALIETKNKNEEKLTGTRSENKLIATRSENESPIEDAQSLMLSLNDIIDQSKSLGSSRLNDVAYKILRLYFEKEIGRAHV